MARRSWTLFLDLWSVDQPPYKDENNAAFGIMLKTWLKLSTHGKMCATNAIHLSAG